MVILFLLFLLFLPSPLRAEDAVGDLTAQIEEYTKKLYELSKSKDTLSNQVKYLEAQISQTQLKIRQTETTISILLQEISVLTTQVEQLDINLNQLTAVFIEQATQNYKLSKKLPSYLSLLSTNFNDFFERYKYISLLQKNNQQTIVDLETTRTNLDLQKQIKTKKQIELSELEKKLEVSKKDLISQKGSKVSLLEITKNDESRYQKLKQQAEAELNSLLTAKFVGKREVKKGEALGLMGNTGYSFGDHLHFGLYDLSESSLSSWTYANDIDPLPYLQSHIWPMLDPVQITQERGRTKYSYLYSDRFHHGIDMVSINKTVRAINDGVAYFYRNTSSSLGNHVKLFHPDGKMSLYLHLQ